jgi:hypothetical protein
MNEKIIDELKNELTDREIWTRYKRLRPSEQFLIFLLCAVRAERNKCVSLEEFAAMIAQREKIAQRGKNA